jgi:hypothetical protein
MLGFLARLDRSKESHGQQRRLNSSEALPRPLHVKSAGGRPRDRISGLQRMLVTSDLIQLED